MELFNTFIKEQYNIYILSSSINLSNIKLAKENPSIIDLIEKALNKESLSKVFEMGYKF
ncbi:MAG: hypothetical protein ACJAWA_000015 [Nonlabens sp.]